MPSPGVADTTADWIEQVTEFMVLGFDDEIAHTEGLNFTEVVDLGSTATLIDRHGGLHPGTFNGTTKQQARYWAVTVPDEARVLELAGHAAEAVDSAV